MLLLLIYLVFRIYEPFLTALGWAAILAIFFYPLHRRLAGHFPANRAAMLSTLAVTILLIAPAIVVTTLFVREALSISRGVQHSFVEQHAPLIAKSWSWIARHVPGLDPNADVFDMLEQKIEKQAGYLAERLGTVLRNIAAFLFDLFVTSLVIAAIQGILGGLGLALVGLPAPVFWGVAMAFFSLVPVVGSGLIFVPAALWLGVSGHWGRALLLLVICVVVSTVIDNVLRPFLLGGRTQLSALLVFISVVGGVGIFGMLGLVLGPILVATAASILTAYTDKAESPPLTAA